MKTISLKADKAFENVLCEIAEHQQISRSAVIREAVIRYRAWLEHEKLRKQVYQASLKTREHQQHLMDSMDQANSDGL